MAASGMGPDGRRLTGPDYLRFLFEMAMVIPQGSYPMNASVGSRVHERLGESVTAAFDGLLTVSLAEVVDQIGEGLALDRVQVIRHGGQVRADLHVRQTIDGGRVTLTGVRVVY